MTSEQAEPETTEPSSSEDLPPPPPPDEEPAPERKSSEDIWREDYDELVEPEEERPKRKKSKHWGAIFTVIAIIVILAGWSLASPDVLDPVGDRYTTSAEYATWGNYTGHVESWAGNTTWCVSVSGQSLSPDNRSVRIDVLVTKVSERTANWFLTGTAIELRNVSVFTVDGIWLASMSNNTDLGFGVLASVPVTFASTGEYDLYVTVKFLVYEDMRIGFLPLRMVNIEAVYVEPTISVTVPSAP